MSEQAGYSADQHAAAVSLSLHFHPLYTLLQLLRPS
jgi:hypothetical protein